MSLPPPPRELSRELPNGDLVCYNHYLPVCHRCCVDFTFMQEERDSLESSQEGSEDEEEDNQPLSSDAANSDRVFVLVGGVARFIPQWDQQLLGPANTFRIQQDYDHPPTPSAATTLNLHHCRDCQLTWLIGENGPVAAASHPSHHTYLHIYAGTSRSILVFVDGACSSNGSVNARAGVGIYFQDGSKFNISEAFTLQGVATNQRAELHAVARALEVVRTQVMPERRTHVSNAEGGHQPAAVRDTKRLRLIVTTDSSYVVEGMCAHFQQWTVDKTNGTIKNKRGKVVKNSEGFLRIKSEVEALSIVGVQVVYYHVCREENAAADGLARAAIVKP